MSAGRRIWIALMVALVAMFFAKGMGIPLWRDWDIGDQADIALCTFCAIYSLLRPNTSHGDGHE
ncbi:hypothetical protein KFK14_11175 [Sphingobium phenoxybenzoativorans]|uniref:Uncharacterized protein n=1 Tax=Sphingobium phenoxybenzoativorans TaxID=1592790 RepID=A0A975KAN9_9SPHN|nr:hypothetical protein [Sphingobium phenoxybenzoativorans]QUT07890.1 hypothetical protein KFK14_11175 [Sphingobium phenoxybenzoativorans]